MEGKPPLIRAISRLWAKQGGTEWKKVIECTWLLLGPIQTSNFVIVPPSLPATLQTDGLIATISTYNAGTPRELIILGGPMMAIVKPPPHLGLVQWQIQLGFLQPAGYWSRLEAGKSCWWCCETVFVSLCRERTRHCRDISPFLCLN